MLRGKSGPVPEPLTPQHVIMELAVTYEMKAEHLSRAAGVDGFDITEGQELDTSSTSSLHSRDLMAVFDRAPTSASACAHAARVGFK